MDPIWLGESSGPLLEVGCHVATPTSTHASNDNETLGTFCGKGLKGGQSVITGVPTAVP